jgi:hypothetical protein
MTDPRTPRTEAGRAIDAVRAIVQQSLDAVRGEDDGESRSIRASIAAREHVLSLIDGYRDRIEAEASLGSSERLAAALEDHNYLDIARRCDCGDWSESDGGYFTDHLAAAILAALAEASTRRQRAIGEATRERIYDVLVRIDETREPGAYPHFGPEKDLRRLADDLAAALSDPDAERQRAIGEAVERLPAWSRIDRTDVRWRVLLYRGDAEMRKGYGTAMDMVARDDLPAAIAAALPAAQGPER